MSEGRKTRCGCGSENIHATPYSWECNRVMPEDSQKDRPWRNKHHIWCNFFSRKASDCEQCSQLFELYPYETEEEMQTLAERHFGLAEEG